jgi:hypothetical protein
MWVQDENGEWFDDGLPEEEVAVPFMPPPNRYESRPVGPSAGRRTGKGELAQIMLDMESERTRIPPRPTLLNNVSYEAQPGQVQRGAVDPTLLTNIDQYRGKPNSLFIDENEGELIRYDESGQETGERGITEKKIRPPGPKPTPDKLDRMLFTKEHMTGKDPELQERAEKAAKEWENSIPYTTRALKPEVFDMKRAEIRKAFYNEYRNEELQLVGQFITEKQVEANKTAATPPQATEWGLRERAAKGDPVAIKALESEKEGKGDVTPKDIYSPILKQLPKKKAEAETAERRVIQYEKLSEMAEKGAGGLVPGLKGILSPVLEALGMDAKIESEAQAYQLMARAGVGSMRLMLVGSGQVSNYEQDLMQRLSGGSIKTSREAAKLLFDYYASESRHTVAAYNKQIDDISEELPSVKKAHGYVGKGDKRSSIPGPAVKQRLTPQQALDELRRRGKL